MLTQQLRDPVLFNGVSSGTLAEVHIVEDDIIEFGLKEFGIYKIMGPPPQVCLTFQFVFDAQDGGAYAALSMIEHGQQLVSLGPGFVCDGCGVYNPAGRMICDLCGALATKQPMITPRHFPYFLSRFHTEVWGDMVAAEADFTSEGVLVKRKTTLDWGAVLTLPQATSLRRGVYLCRYCGQAVAQGATCQGCGGPRQPLQELVTLDRTCIYCGNPVNDGIVCVGCGARIRGLTLGKVLDGNHNHLPG